MVVQLLQLMGGLFLRGEYDIKNQQVRYSLTARLKQLLAVAVLADFHVILQVSTLTRNILYGHMQQTALE